MPERVTDFGIGEINIPPSKWRVLPSLIKEKIEVYNTNPDAFVMGRRINGEVCFRFIVANHRVDENLADLAALNA